MAVRDKTVAAWLAFLGGPFGLHRFYLRGFRDPLGWLLPLPTLLGLHGIERARTLGLDDRLSWALIPLLGFVVAGCALAAIVHGLASTEKWNRRFNPALPEDAPPGRTGWATVFAIVAALLVGAGVLMATLAFAFERCFDVLQAGAR
ncbi:MAG: hypothetical protein PGN26_09780 [Xylophilus ampelinus]